MGQHALRRLGKTRGRRLTRAPRTSERVDAQFDEFCDWHYFPLMAVGLRDLRRRGATDLTDRCWYGPRR